MGMRDVWSKNGVELRMGRWQDVLADVTRCDSVITDPPYGQRTHQGNHGMRDRFGSADRTDISYPWMTIEDVDDACAALAGLCSSWMVVFSDDSLAPVWSSKPVGPLSIAGSARRRNKGRCCDARLTLN
jgi:hypothetical protein